MEKKSDFGSLFSKIGFKKNLDFGQQNASERLIGPMTPRKCPILTGFTDTKPILCSINPDSIMSRAKNEEGTLVLKTIKSCSKC
jgi:hypothetical protein